MVINVVVPKQFGYLKLLNRTRKFYNLTLPKKSIHIPNKYFFYITKTHIGFSIFEESDEVQSELNRYLDFVFGDSYIGIQKGKEFLQPSDVKVYYI